MFLASYPITPASDILRELPSHQNFGVRTMQAEDEIAAVGAALGLVRGPPRGHDHERAGDGPQGRNRRPGHQPGPPSLAFMLSHLARGPHEPTPVGVFRAVERPDYGSLVNRKVLEARERQGPGELAELLSSGTTWDV